MNETPVKVLLVDDDEDDFVITRALISEIGAHRYRLDWVSSYKDAMAAIQRLLMAVGILVLAICRQSRGPTSQTVTFSPIISSKDVIACRAKVVRCDRGV